MKKPVETAAMAFRSVQWFDETLEEKKKERKRQRRRVGVGESPSRTAWP